jgi:hypothetical protein
VICHEARVVYIHQRKCAGHSIMAAFGKQADTPERHAFNNGTLDERWSECPRSYFLFSSVRSPYSRVVSAWQFLWPQRKRSLLEVLREPKLSPKQWRHLMRPQVAILKENGKLITDWLVRVESLQSDFDLVCDRIGKARVELPRLNPARKPYRSHREAITPEARRVIETLFAADFEALGYEW